MKTLLLTDPMPAGYFRPAIHAIAPDAELIDYRRDMSDAELAAIDVVLAWRFPPGVAGRLTSLKWVCSVAAGVEKLLVPDLAPAVTRASASHAARRCSRRATMCSQTTSMPTTWRAPASPRCTTACRSASSMCVTTPN